jgi:hypothetical protein
MTNKALSKEIKAFIDSNVRTIEDLEALQLIRSDQKRKWDAVQVSREIGIDLHLASDHLTWLCSKGLLRQSRSKDGPGPYTYRAPSPGEEKLLIELENVFLNSRAEIMQHIVQNQIRAIGKKLSTIAKNPKKKNDPKP